MSDGFERSIKAEVDRITRSLSAFAYQQVPFATAQALNAIAKLVKEGEAANIKAVMPTATPFTVNSVGMLRASKTNLQAIVFVKDIAATYLAPFEESGKHTLPGKGIALLNPKNVTLDAYGNIPKGTLRRYRGRKDVFVGSVKTASGTVSGVWQRPLKGKALRRKRGLARANVTGKLKLLVRFGEALPVKQHLGYRERAAKIIEANYKAEFGRALGKAIATAKR